MSIRLDIHKKLMEIIGQHNAERDNKKQGSLLVLSSMPKATIAPIRVSVISLSSRKGNITKERKASMLVQSSIKMVKPNKCQYIKRKNYDRPTESQDSI